MDIEEARWQQEEFDREMGYEGMIQRHLDLHGIDPATEGDWEREARKEPDGDEDLPDPPEQINEDPPDNDPEDLPF